MSPRSAFNASHNAGAPPRPAARLSAVCIFEARPSFHEPLFPHVLLVFFGREPPHLFRPFYVTGMAARCTFPSSPPFPVTRSADPLVSQSTLKAGFFTDKITEAPLIPPPLGGTELCTRAHHLSLFLAAKSVRSPRRQQIPR